MRGGESMSASRRTRRGGRARFELATRAAKQQQQQRDAKEGTLNEHTQDGSRRPLRGQGQGERETHFRSTPEHQPARDEGHDLTSPASARTSVHSRSTDSAPFTPDSTHLASTGRLASHDVRASSVRPGRRRTV